MAGSLRYISKDLYEKGDKYAIDVQKKFFEYYCLPFEVGGRRTAAIVASQYLKKMGCISTVYAANNIKARTFYKNYVVAREKTKGICIFQATYAFTNHARPPDDGKLRDIKPDLNWLSVGGQHIMPKPGVWKRPPISLNLIYT